LPLGPGELKIRYRFAAVAAYEGETVPAPTLPECLDDGNPPVADMDIEPSGDDGIAREGRDVRFLDRSSDPDGDLSKYEWDFGDGKTATGSDVHHLYDDNGTYQVKLTVTDGKGHSDTTERELVVENEPPEAGLEDGTGTADTATLAFSMIDPGHVDKANLHYELTSPDPAVTQQIGDRHAATGQFGPWVGLPAGTYPFELKVTDRDGASDSDTAVLTITEEAPTEPPSGVPGGTYATCDPNVKLDAEERTFVDLVNDYRRKNGLQPVAVSATLTKAAERHASDMAAHNFMAHQGTDGSWPWDRAWASGYPTAFGVSENVAEGGVADQLLAAWRGSTSGHNENMLDPRWREIGLAAVHEASAPGAYHGLDVTIVAADFGVRR
jgi:uncharacterized protein YkwD